MPYDRITELPDSVKDNVPKRIKVDNPPPLP